MKAFHGEQAEALVGNANAENCGKVTNGMGSMSAALCDHVSENGKSKATKDPQDAVLGQQIQAHMVNGHGKQSDQLELIGGKPKGAFGNLFHGQLLSLLDYSMEEKGQSQEKSNRLHFGKRLAFFCKTDIIAPKEGRT